MNLRFRSSCLARLGSGCTLLAGVGLLAGCRHESVTPGPVVDYFPVVLGTYRTYAVADSSWLNGVVTVRNYQFREVAQDQFTDAAGQPATRLVRAKRLTAADAWVADSVLVVQRLPQAVLLTRNNVRTVELLYPPRAGKGWNATAFTVGTSQPDTISNVTRYYAASVGTAYTTPAVAGQAAKSYDVTAATYDKFSVADNDGKLRRSGLLQVYAAGVGRVVRRRYSYYTFTTKPSGEQVPTTDVQNGASRRETLLETGTL